jgi:hypothetical protein
MFVDPFYPMINVYHQDIKQVHYSQLYQIDFDFLELKINDKFDIFVFEFNFT